MSSHTAPLSHTDPSSDTPDASTILRQFMHQLQQEQQQQFSSSLYGTLQPYRFQPQEFHTSLSSQPPPILGLDDSIQPPPQPSPDLLNDVKPMIRDHMSFDPHDITTPGDGDEIVPAIKPRRKRRKKFSPMDEAEAKALRTKKHSEAEVRRRHKFNELLVDLAKMFNCEKSQKIDILKTIISDVESMRAKIAAYEQRHGPLPDEHNDNSDIHESHKQPDTIHSNNTSDIDTTVDTEHNDNNMTVQVGGRISILTMDPAQAQVAATQNMLAAMSQHQRRSQNMQTGPSHDPSMSLVPSSTPSPSPYPPSSSDDPYGIMSQHRQLISPVDHRMLFISSNIAMDVADLSGRIIDCNTHFCELLGYTKSSLLAPSNFFRITHPDSLAHTFAVLSSLLTGGRTAQRSRRKYITRTGMISEVMITCWLTRDHDQQPQYVVEIVEPI